MVVFYWFGTIFRGGKNNATGCVAKLENACIFILYMLQCNCNENLTGFLRPFLSFDKNVGSIKVRNYLKVFVAESEFYIFCA